MIKNLYKGYVYFVIFEMRKIISTLFIVFVWFIWFSRWRTYYTTSPSCSWDWKFYQGISWSCGKCNFCEWALFWDTWQICQGVEWQRSCCSVGSVVINGKCKKCDSLTPEQAGDVRDDSNCRKWCSPSQKYKLSNWLRACCIWVVNDNLECDMSLSEFWININTNCLLNWQCSLNVYKVLWIRKQDQNPTVLWFFQDITLASTTAILWTVIIIAIIISWLMFAFASITWKDTKRAKTILIDAFVWLLLVMWSYSIIRLIQFLATAWS